MKENRGLRTTLALTLTIALSFSPISLAQSSNAMLSPADALKLKQENDAFIKATAEATPIIEKRLANRELRLTSLLQQLSDAEKTKNTAVGEKLAVQIGVVDEEVTRLHEAQLDLRKVGNVSALASKSLTEDNPSGQMCSSEGCGSVPAWVAIASILTAGLVEELNKKEPFGPHNEIMKGLHSIGDFVQCIFGCK